MSTETTTDENLETPIVEDGGAKFDSGEIDETEIVGDSVETTELDPPEKKFTQEDMDYQIKKRLERKREDDAALEQKMSDIQQERDALLKKYEPGDEFLELPEPPDEYADDYEEKKKVYEALRTRKIKAQGKAEALAEIRKENDDMMLKEATKNQEANDKKIMGEYNDRSNKYGISEKTLDDINSLFKTTYAPRAAEYILNNIKGPLVGEYFLKNAVEFEKVAAMPLHQQTEYIISEIAPKCKPKQIKKPLAEVAGDEPSFSGRNSQSGGTGRRAKFE